MEGTVSVGESCCVGHVTETLTPGGDDAGGCRSGTCHTIAHAYSSSHSVSHNSPPTRLPRTQQEGI